MTTQSSQRFHPTMSNTSRDDIRAILQQMLDGIVSPEAVLGTLIPDASSYERVNDFAKIDVRRRERTGVPEFIYAPGKTPEQIVAIADRMIESGGKNILATKVTLDVSRRICELAPDAVWHSLSGLVTFNPDDAVPVIGSVGIVTAGTSDLPVAEEAELACRAIGSRTTRITDVGVACLARTLDAVPSLQENNVIICIAGMEATLPSVLSGLVSVPIIAVPTSIGYGVNVGGFNALFSILGSCTPGVLAVNIDNGIGAAAAAHRINLLAEGRRP